MTRWMYTDHPSICERIDVEAKYWDDTGFRFKSTALPRFCPLTGYKLLLICTLWELYDNVVVVKSYKDSFTFRQVLKDAGLLVEAMEKMRVHLAFDASMKQFNFFVAYGINGVHHAKMEKVIEGLLGWYDVE